MEITAKKEGEGIADDDYIAKKAKELYPYDGEDNPNRINKISSKRRRFIEGAKWMRDEVKPLPLPMEERQEETWDDIWNKFELQYDSNPLIYTSPNKFKQWLKENYSSPNKIK